jgi:hypothetical protein
MKEYGAESEIAGSALFVWRARFGFAWQNRCFGSIRTVDSLKPPQLGSLLVFSRSLSLTAEDFSYGHISPACVARIQYPFPSWQLAGMV